MNKRTYLAMLAGSAAVAALTTAASATEFNIPRGDLKTALDSYARQAGVQLMYPDDEMRNARTPGASGELTADVALSRILRGTGFVTQRVANAIAIVRQTAPAEMPPRLAGIGPIRVAAAAASGIESVVVTSSKIKGDIQTVPIAITALSQEQLTSRQIAGGPDLVKEVPNLTFSKTNFTGYNIQIRGIGTQAISVTTDPAVAVSFNDIPFIRNHFFEQEFYDVSQVEVLRGPQGTLYGRNATAGVVNVVSAKPTDQLEAQLSADWGNYSNRRYEGMVNVPIWGDKLDLRVASEWTKRDGYASNDITKSAIDGRDLWSGRVSLLLHPFEKLTATAVWEHFQENDSRARSTKQLCARADAPAVVNGPAGPQVPNLGYGGTNFGAEWLSQGCHAASLYSPESYQTPNGGAIPFVAAFGPFFFAYIPLDRELDPYASVSQSHDLREISSQIDPTYRAKNDTFEFNLDYDVTPQLSFTSQTAYNNDLLYSVEDYNRFNTTPNFLQDQANGTSVLGDSPYPSLGTFVGQDNEYCDPQLGCSSRFLAVDRSSETAHQFYQELRLKSDFQGPLNFVAGANYLRYQTTEDYYIFSNLISLLVEATNQERGGGDKVNDASHIPFDASVANSCDPQPASPQLVTTTGFFLGLGCAYIDPNPISQVNGEGHNYFLSHNPYQLSSWATFGEAYYQISQDVKLIGGLRYTDDRKDFWEYPSWTLVLGKGIPQQGMIQQEWKEVTGRAVVNWTPTLNFTDQTLVYASYARGYKGGGANPPGVTPVYFGTQLYSSPSDLTHPATFKPEFNDAFELGTKNSLLDGGLTLNADMFFYKYRNYQISQIVDRTAVNLNFDATVRGAELEASWEPSPGLKFGFSGGYENATINDGQSAIDLMDRTAGHSDWMVVKPGVTATSNCIIPTDAVNEMLRYGSSGAPSGLVAVTAACQYAYTLNLDPVTKKPYSLNPNSVKFPGYVGFDPLMAPNGGQGFAKDVGGNQLPNTPHFTTSLSADYTMPLSDDWAGTLHGDFYWQSQSYWRIFNDLSYDKLRGYSNVNLALIFTNQDGWQVMGYLKNVFNTTAINGAFLNSDDSALTTNVFITDPRLYGVRVTKSF